MLNVLTLTMTTHSIFFLLFDRWTHCFSISSHYLNFCVAKSLKWYCSSFFILYFLIFFNLWNGLDIYLWGIITYLKCKFVLAQDSSRLLAGEKGYGHLKNLQKSLRLRQQYMVTQVTLLYPVKVVVRKSSEQELESFRSSIKSGNCW